MLQPINKVINRDDVSWLGFKPVFHISLSRGSSQLLPSAVSWISDDSCCEYRALYQPLVPQVKLLTTKSLTHLSVFQQDLLLLLKINTCRTTERSVARGETSSNPGDIILSWRYFLSGDGPGLQNQLGRRESGDRWVRFPCASARSLKGSG